MWKLVLLSLFLVSCEKDCPQTIVGVQFNASKASNSFEETSFLTDTISLTAQFDIDATFSFALSRCKEPLNNTNAFVSSSVQLYCDQDLYSGSDTFRSRIDNLTALFETTITDEPQDKAFVFKNKKPLANKTGFYSFYFSCALSDGIVVSDSCLVKITFK